MYLTLKALHILCFIAWMAGLLYLPRLYVYHTRFEKDSFAYATFCQMERRLSLYIMSPAGVATLITGTILLFKDGLLIDWPWWRIIKISCAGLLLFFNIWFYNLGRVFWRRGTPKSEIFYRSINEWPFLLAGIMVFMVVIKPF